MRIHQDRRFPETVDPAWRVGIVHSTYYKEEIDALAAGALEVLLEAGLKKENVTFHPAPGSFELPLIGAALAEGGKVDAMIAFGIIVQGATHHARLLADEVARGIMDIQVRHRVPFAFEVLFVDDLAQARERAAPGEGNKGREAAYAVLHSLAELARIRGMR